MLYLLIYIIIYLSQPLALWVEGLNVLPVGLPSIVSLLDVGASYHLGLRPHFIPLAQVSKTLDATWEGIPYASFLKQAGRERRASLPSCLYRNTQPATRGSPSSPHMCQVQAWNPLNAALTLWANLSTSLFWSLVFFLNPILFSIFPFLWHFQNFWST